MKVVVVCNCYKRLAFTKLCLPFAVKHAGIEATWLLVDDGSDDGTAKFLQSLARDKENVVVRCHKENRGHYVLRNEGFAFGKEQGADVVVNIDNDILFPANWLKDFVSSFLESEFDVGSAWVINDKTLYKHVEESLGASVSDVLLDRWVDTGACGGACIAHSRAVLDSDCRYDEGRTLFCYGDSAFNGKCKRTGFKVGVYLGVQCWHLQMFVWTEDDYEKDKLRNRHQHRLQTMDGFEESWEIHKGRLMEDVHIA